MELTKINVNTSVNYDVIIGRDLLSDVGTYLKSITKAKNVVVITDDIVNSLYSSVVVNSLKENGYKPLKFIIKNGEASKNGSNFLEICSFLAKNYISKNDIIIALGGGVVGDLAGFVAASYLRGIDFIQIPTTLLAAVDSSVGGKTAIDIDSGKNLIGAFHQPRLVICDYSTLSTLKPNIFIDGCAEVIKYSVIGNETLFNHLFENGKDFDLEYVISECIKMKRDIVQLDEFDAKERQKLNLGHTIGHAIELCSKFSISHGSAVAIGLSIITKYALSNGICNQITYDRIIELLKKFELPIKTSYTKDELLKIILTDKKRSGDSINLIIPFEIGDSRIVKTNINDLKSILEAGL